MLEETILVVIRLIALISTLTIKRNAKYLKGLRFNQGIEELSSKVMNI